MLFYCSMFYLFLIFLYLRYFSTFSLCLVYIMRTTHCSVTVPQAPVFISFFIALRKMAYLPVPSLQTGGLLWFVDLTAADPFYILPVFVTGTMFFILEVRLLLFNSSQLQNLAPVHLYLSSFLQ